MLFRTLFNKQERAIEVALPTPYLLPQPLTGALSVSSTSTLSIPAAYRCVAMISDTVGSLPLHARRGRVNVEPTPQLLENPDRSQTRVETISSICASMAINGNAYLLLGDRDRLGYPRSALVLNPDAVNVQLNNNGVIQYLANGRPLESDDVMHIRSGILQGGSITGTGVLAVARETLGLAMGNEQTSAEMLTTGSIPSGVIQAQGEITKEEADAIKQAWIAAHGGRQMSPAVLSGGLEYKTLSFSASDMQLLEARKMSAQQVCQLFGVPAFLVGVPTDESRTYSNVQQDTRAFVNFCLRGYLTKIEAAFTKQLPRGQYARFDLDDLLRASRLERYQSHEIGLRNGWLSAEEVRAMEELEEADTALVEGITE
jgi:HK97 family phage portal protein